MIKQETIELAAKWWKNKIKHNVTNMLNSIEAKKDESITSTVAYYVFLKDVLDKLDTFEESFIDVMKEYKGDKCALYFSHKGLSPIFSDVLKRAEIYALYIPNITTVVINDEFLLIRFPCVSYSSIVKITSEDQLINDGEDWV